MDSPRFPEPKTTLLSCNTATTNATRRRSSDSNSPEFEFCNPSCPQPNLLSADELFVDGFLLPLHLLPHKPSDPPDPDPQPQPLNKEPEEPEPEPGPRPDQLTHVTVESANGLTSSKRWTDIFKKGDKKASTKATEDKDKEKEKEKEKRSRDKKSQGGVSSSAELNINIWPFSRSRSAGNNGSRHRMVPATRKVSSAPCSRSNSAGESKSRKWPSSPSRAGVHLGRSRPIWQVKRGGSGSGAGMKSSEAIVARSGEKGVSKKEVSSKSKLSSSNGNGKVKVLNLNVNVPMCMGYRHHLSCRSDENSALGVVGVSSNKTSNSNTSTTGSGGGGVGGATSNVTSSGHLFNLRSLFTKKVY